MWNAVIVACIKSLSYGPSGGKNHKIPYKERPVFRPPLSSVTFYSHVCLSVEAVVKPLVSCHKKTECFASSLHKIKIRKANGIGNILRRNCLLKLIIKGKIEGGIEVTGRQIYTKFGRLHRLYEQVLHIEVLEQ
jgi:hypothetical protein